MTQKALSRIVTFEIWKELNKNFNVSRHWELFCEDNPRLVADKKLQLVYY